MTAGPLARFTVLDLTPVRAGPTAVRYFADWGANVIKIEMPPGGRCRHGRAAPRAGLPEPAPQQALDYAQPQGAGWQGRLPEDSREADVVIENYRADVKFRSASTTKACRR